MNVFVSTRAKLDLEAIYARGRSQFGEEAADSYLAEIVEKFRFLASWPLSNQERMEVRPPVRISIFKGHLIIYRIDVDVLKIVRVLSRFENWQDEI
jgi:plasmid stabilization system protein ParE